MPDSKLLIIALLGIVLFPLLSFGASYGNVDGQGYGAFKNDVNGNRFCFLSGSCVTSWPTGSGGGSYTSGTPKTLQVDNDLNKISLNFDGNFWSRLNALIPWADLNVADDITAVKYLANAYLPNLFPVPDVNVSDDLTIQTVKKARFRDIDFNGVLSGGDFNYSLGDANAVQSCGGGQFLNSVGPGGPGCASAGGGGTDTNKVGASVTDINAGYIINKLIPGKRINLRLSDVGGNETIGIDSNETACTVTVGSNGDYNDIPSAVDSLASTGGRVCVGAGTFQLTRSIDINNNQIEIVGQGVATFIRTNPAIVPTAIKIGDNTQHSYIRLANFGISASANTGTGTAIDASNFAISHIQDIYISGYNHGIDLNKNNTFYNEISNVRISVTGVGSFGIRINDGAHENTIFRTRIITDGNGTGILLKNSHGNSLYETNIESGSAVGIDVNTGAHDTTIIGPYMESNVINLRLANGVESTTIIGGTIESGTTADMQNNGAVGLTMLGVQFSFDPSRNQLASLDLNGSLCLTGDCRTSWPSSGGGGNGTTYTSGTPATVQVNNDTNTISINFDGNFFIRLPFPVADVNVVNDLTINTTKDLTGITFTFTGKGNVKDLNASTGDVNANRICLTQDTCRTTWPSGTGGTGDGGTTYTTDTPKFLEIRPDTNKINMQFDSNFWSYFSSIMPLGDSNISDAITVSNYLANAYLGNLFPVPDVNVANDLTINTTKDANFRNISFTGVLSGGDYNFSLLDSNNTQDCGVGNYVQAVGAGTLTCASASGTGVNWTQINATLPHGDVNVADDITTQLSHLRFDDNSNLKNLMCTFFDQNWLVQQTVLNQYAVLGGGVMWTDMNALPNELFKVYGPNGNSNNPGGRWIMDLNNATQFQIILDFNRGAPANAILWLQFSDDNSTWYDANIVSTAWSGRVRLGPSNNIIQAGLWADINQTVNRNNIYYRIMGMGGDNTSDPVLKGITVKYRGKASSFC